MRDSPHHPRPPKGGRPRRVQPEDGDCVLLDRSTLCQVGHHRLLVWSPLARSVQLARRGVPDQRGSCRDDLLGSVQRQMRDHVDGRDRRARYDRPQVTFRAIAWQLPETNKSAPQTTARHHLTRCWISHGNYFLDYVLLSTYSFLVSTKKEY